jgi:molybdopterin-containing oxidoreductase family iron-sulfur binding subunit
LTLYDPDRAQTVKFLGRPRTFEDVIAALRTRLGLDGSASGSGKGLRVLTGRVTSPTLASQLDQMRKDFPEGKWHQYEPAVSDAPLAGARLAFGQEVQPRYQLAGPAGQADVIVSLDADFLGHGPGHLRYMREFSARRSGQVAKVDKMNRLYVAESMFTTTGAVADHRLAVPASQVEALARALAAKLSVAGITADAGVHAMWIEAVARDLQFIDGDRNKGKRPPGSTLVIAGETQPPAVHALAYAVNSALGNIGKTVVFTRPVAAQPVEGLASLKELVTAMEAGAVDVLLILGGNPVFTAPANLRFADAMKKVPLRVHLGLYFDETSTLCQWQIPETHFLETWSDSRAFDGTVTIQQPLIEPLYKSSSAHELLSAVLDKAPRTGHDLVRDHLQKEWERRNDRSGAFDTFWHNSLHNGIVADTAFEPIAVTLKSDFAASLPAASQTASGLEVVFRPDPAVFDGQFANNGWLQELPRPLTKLTWDNAAILSPRTAEELGVSKVRFGWNGGEHGEAYTELLTLRLDGRELTLPAWVLPGHADGSITVHFGEGRRRGGRVCEKVGFDAYQLRGSDRPWIATGATVSLTGRQHLLACTQGHYAMQGRSLVRWATVKEHEKEPHFAQKPDEEAHVRAPEKRQPLTLIPEHEYKGHKWGMVINLGACTGCGACVVACQAENNIPVVGKDQVSRGRAMHWLRIDRYFHGDPYGPPQDFHALHQPVPCMQCENAPCELVCPVAATVHSNDGLNDMVYNRCVGTRYCSNNCPYKVRRFNFLEFADFTTPTLKLMRNPEVTVRSRGVMEKCTYCVQRIRAAEITAEREQRPAVNGQQGAAIYDGEVLTACQAACPAQAIVFGDLTGPDARGTDGSKSQVGRLRASSLNYSLLDDLNTRPRTTYLAAVRNPNPELA